jgi:hypothetical protein
MATSETQKAQAFEIAKKEMLQSSFTITGLMDSAFKIH